MVITDKIWEQLFPTITEKVEKYAKNRQYDNIEIVGRAGWEKVLNGYKKEKVILRKEIQ